MKRILALDGGGIRGLFTLQVLKRIESLFRDEHQRPDLVLADVFDLFAGTSTGAIIAAALCWGMSVSEVEDMYVQNAAQIFSRSRWIARWKAKYRADRLADLFRTVFSEDGSDRRPALLGTSRLKKLLLVVMRNATTGSPWPVTNNRAAKYNEEARPNCNLQIPLWQLIRASTAAPTFFAPESITLGDQTSLFVDGAITPFNNPALIAVLTATLPCYRIGWPATRESLYLASIGTGSTRVRLLERVAQRVNLLHALSFVPSALLGASPTQQDMICRVLGDCLYGAPIDAEIGNLCEPTLLERSEQKFTYVRYNLDFDTNESIQILPRILRGSIDDLRLIPILQEIGRQYAEEVVLPEHLQPRKFNSAAAIN